jgi:hypothetical protein
MIEVRVKENVSEDPYILYNQPVVTTSIVYSKKSSPNFGQSKARIDEDPHFC